MNGDGRAALAGYDYGVCSGVIVSGTTNSTKRMYCTYSNTNPCTPPLVFDSSSSSCVAPLECEPWQTPSEDNSQCLDPDCEADFGIGWVFDQNSHECRFDSCPPDYMKVGTQCHPLPQTDCAEGEITVCNSSGCSCQLPTCSPSSPDYTGTSTTGMHICGDAPQCGVGECVGYFNNVQICRPCGSDPADPSPPLQCSGGKVEIDGICDYPPDYVQETINQSVVIGSDGSTTTTTTTTTTVTNSSGQSSQTTTTEQVTLDSNGNPVSSSSSSETVDGAGAGDGADSEVRGGGDCSTPPSCINADAVACATLRQVWEVRCQDSDFDAESAVADDAAAVSSELSDFSDSLDQLIADTAGEDYVGSETVDLSNLELSYTSDPGSCPADIPIELGSYFPTVVVPISSLCSFLSMIAFLVRLSAAYLGFQIVYRSFSTV